MNSEDHVGRIVNRLGSVWPKTLAITPTHVAAYVTLPNKSQASVAVDLDTWIVTEDGNKLGTISEEIRRRLGARFPEVAEQIGLEEIAGDVEAFFTLEMPDWEGSLDGAAFHACLQWQPDESQPPEFHPLSLLLVKGKASINVAEIELTHKKLGEFSVAYGAGRLGDSDAVLVVAEDEDGGKAALRLDTAT